MEIIKPRTYYPPPWNLKGEGIIIVYNFKKEWIEKNGLLTLDKSGDYRGGLGFVMLVNYHESPVGPYKELLIIPGKYNPHKRQVISHIFVDSHGSTENGRYNWGIPKKTVPMIWQTEGGMDTIGVARKMTPFYFVK